MYLYRGQSVKNTLLSWSPSELPHAQFAKQLGHGRIRQPAVPHQTSRRTDFRRPTECRQHLHNSLTDFESRVKNQIVVERSERWCKIVTAVHIENDEERISRQSGSRRIADESRAGAEITRMEQMRRHRYGDSGHITDGCRLRRGCRGIGCRSAGRRNRCPGRHCRCVGWEYRGIRRQYRCVRR